MLIGFIVYGASILIWSEGRCGGCARSVDIFVFLEILFGDKRREIK